MALPPTIVIVLATIVIVLAARPTDWAPPVRETLTAGSELTAVDRPDDDRPVRPIRRASASVPPPERVIYAPGWRSAAASGAALAKPAITVHRGTMSVDDTGWSAPWAVQAP